ncbi:hypothetical protein OROGR_021468 [Orobanche gracilis]
MLTAIPFSFLVVFLLSARSLPLLLLALPQIRFQFCIRFLRRHAHHRKRMLCS